MEDEYKDEYIRIVKYINKATETDTKKGVFFWYNPRVEEPWCQFIDRDLKLNVYSRIREGATEKEIIESFDRQAHKLSGDKDKDRCAITTFFSRKNFWGED